MKIDVSQTLSGFDGKPVKMSGKDATLKDVILSALMTVAEGERPSGKDKFTWYELARNINKSGSINLKSEDIVLIKDRVGKIFNPIVVGRVYDILEGNKS